MGKMETLGLTTLVAYVDGELVAEDAAAVEAHLEADADARDIVRKLRQSALLVRVAHEPVTAEPVPPGLVETVLTAPASLDTAPAVRRLRFLSWDMPLAQVAAMVALLVIGLGGGFGVTTYSGAVSERAELAAGEALRAQLAATRDEALETLRSGASMTWTSPDGQATNRILPVKTTYSAETGYCREYQRVSSTGSESIVVHGVACRTAAGTWQPRYELVKDAEIAAVSPW